MYQSTRSTLKQEGNYYSAGAILGDGFQPEDTGVIQEYMSAALGSILDAAIVENISRLFKQKEI